MKDNPWSYDATCGRLADMDLTGWQVDATDGHIGEVDDQCDETGGAYLVVHAGAWIFGKVLVPAGAVSRVDHDAHTLHLSLSRGQVEEAPPFLSDHNRADRQYRHDVVEYYWKSRPC
ncbi:PRC-barrel domain containing protein [Streptomyces sp. NPDC089795]|uniref:PRC-barrel domain containing protein n=1 Tax=Streptomyces sp. NPDC089795 TaxID=3155297 RepID=UPI003414C3A8